MLAISSGAAEAIKQIVTSSEVPEDGGVRITLEPIDETRAKLDLSLAGEAEPGDTSVEQQGAKVFLEQNAASALAGKMLDANVLGDQVEFSVIESPQESSPDGQILS